jgi:hypothetical protein
MVLLQHKTLLSFCVETMYTKPSYLPLKQGCIHYRYMSLWTKKFFINFMIALLIFLNVNKISKTNNFLRLLSSGRAYNGPNRHFCLGVDFSNILLTPLQWWFISFFWFFLVKQYTSWNKQAIDITWTMHSTFY